MIRHHWYIISCILYSFGFVYFLLKFIYLLSEDSTDDKASLVQVISRHRKATRHNPKAMLTHFNVALCYHYITMS